MVSPGIYPGWRIEPSTHSQVAINHTKHQLYHGASVNMDDIRSSIYHPCTPNTGRKMEFPSPGNVPKM